MKEYTVRYKTHGTLITVCADGKPIKYTLSEALAKAGEVAMREKTYAKIYKGRTLMHTITVTTEE